MRCMTLMAGLLFALVLSTMAEATTLLKLSLDEMVAQSTDIVRGRVRNCQAAQRGITIVTDCVVTVSERLKGTPAQTMAISVPGGLLKSARGKIRQVIAGAPEFNDRQEYLLFLWTGRNGVTQLIGLSQGVLQIGVQGGQVVAQRAKTADVSFQDPSGREVEDDGVTVTLEAVRRRAAKLAAKQQEAR
jgi:hypothetical protein